MVDSANRRLRYLIIIIAGIVLYFPFLGGIHLFDWDEINFAEAAREMILSNNYFQVQIDYAPFYEKPPLFLWLQVVSFKVLGINEYASRLPNAIFGILSLLLIFHFSIKYLTQKLTVFWLILFGLSLLPYMYFKSGIIDPVFNFFIYSSLLFFYKAHNDQKILKVIIAGILIGLAILAKGPVALLIAVTTLFIYWLFSQKNHLTYIKYLVLYIMVGLLTASSWFLIEGILHGPEFILEFFKYQIRLFSTEDAGHGGFPGFHVVILLIGCFPASIFAIGSFMKKKNTRSNEVNFLRLNKILFWVVLVLFSIVQSKIVHYSSLCYFPLTFMGAHYFRDIYNGQKISKPLQILFYIIGYIILLIFLLLPNIYRFENLLNTLVANDNFAKDLIQVQNPWKLIDNLPWILALSAIVFFIYRSRNKGRNLIISLFMFGLMTISSVYIFPARIEHYTQKSLISTIKDFPSDKFEVRPLGHKSYAHLFYGKKLPTLTTSKKEIIYFSRVDRIPKSTDNLNLKEIKRIPGFVFYEIK